MATKTVWPRCAIGADSGERLVFDLPQLQFAQRCPLPLVSLNNPSMKDFAHKVTTTTSRPAPALIRTLHDQLRSAVARPDRYDPDINQTFNDLAQHYDVVVIPDPPRTPEGKSRVEVGVLSAQRWIHARLRNRTFFSLGAQQCGKGRGFKFLLFFTQRPSDLLE
jgi:hypothetical protein